MEDVMYSWLGAAAISPFVTILSAWTLVVFCTYKKGWRLADLFFFALTAHEIVFSLFAFGFSVLSIIRPLLSAPCGFIVWGLVGTRTFHLSSVTSLLLDRMLASKWPCRYRDSVRSSQVRYHVVVLGIIAIFVGVTAVFARNVSSSDVSVCSIHPLTWDVKFSIFLASVYGMLILTGLVCFTTLMFSKIKPEKLGPKSSITMTEKPSLPPTLDSSGRSTSSSTSKFYKNEWDKEMDTKWQTVASVSFVSYMANHGPFLVMTVMGIVTPRYWTSWQDNITIWLSLSQGILVPFILMVTDVPYRNAVKNMLQQPGRIYRHLSDQSGFRMQVADYKCQKPGFSSSIMMYPPPSCLPIHHNAFQLPHRLRWTPQTLPSLQSLTQGRHSVSPFHALSERDSICKNSSSRCTSPTPPLCKNTLYSTFNSSCHSLIGRSCSSRISNCDHGTQELVDEADTISITTDALDDFEFHGADQPSPTTTRPHVKTIFDSPLRKGPHFSANRNDFEGSVERNEDNSSVSASDSLNSIDGQKRNGSHDRISCIFRPPSRSSRQDVFILNKNVFSFAPPPKPISIDSLDSLEVEEYENCGTADISKLDDNPCYANLREISCDRLPETEEKALTTSPIDQNIIFSEYL